MTGYSEVVKSVQAEGIPVDAPAINFKDKELLFKQCREYLEQVGVDIHSVKKAFAVALKEQETFMNELIEYNEPSLA